jgi:predicted dehydrogenase
MSPLPLKVIALGLTEPIQALLECVWHNESFTIGGLSDPDVDRAGGAARRYECPTFDDVRQMIVQSQADVLFVGLPVHLCAEAIQLALEKQCHIFKTAPAGLNFEQAAQWIRQAARQSRRFLLIQPSRFHPMLDQLRDLLDQAAVNFWHLISLVCHIPQPPLEPDQRWLYDPALSGGGALFQNAYSLIDALLLCFGLPQQVYMQTASQAPDRQQRMNTTEDTALAVMRFSDTLFAQISASRTLGPPRSHLRIHGKDRFVTLTADELTVCSHDGRALEMMRVCEEPIPWADRMLNNLIKNLEKPDQNPLFPPPETDLKTMAVMEAAYLSSKTGMPEAPSRILQLAGFNSDGFW